MEKMEQVQARQITNTQAAAAHDEKPRHGKSTHKVRQKRKEVHATKRTELGLTKAKRKKEEGKRNISCCAGLVQDSQLYDNKMKTMLLYLG